MSTGHIPTLSEIVDQMTVLQETTRDQGEYEAVTAALIPLEDHIARRERIAALTTLAALTIAVRQETRRCARRSQP